MRTYTCARTHDDDDMKIGLYFQCSVQGLQIRCVLNRHAVHRLCHEVHVPQTHCHNPCTMSAFCCCTFSASAFAPSLSAPALTPDRLVISVTLVVRHLCQPRHLRVCHLSHGTNISRFAIMMFHLHADFSLPFFAALRVHQTIVINMASCTIHDFIKEMCSFL